MRRTWQFLFILFVVLFVGAGLALQRQMSLELRGEIDLAREQNREIGRLSAERARLAAAQLPTKELEALRADHAAVLRLRGEVEAMQTRVQEMERGSKM